MIDRKNTEEVAALLNIVQTCDKYLDLLKKQRHQGDPQYPEIMEVSMPWSLAIEQLVANRRWATNVLYDRYDIVLEDRWNA